MDKRSTRILIGCILCTMIVLALFLIVFRFTQLSCELVSLDPVQLASSQLAAFSKDSNKPIRSHDETIVMKISAYLEYNIQPDSGEPPTAPTVSAQFGRPAGLRATDGELAPAPIHASVSNSNFSAGTSNNNNLNTTTSNSFGQQQPMGGSMFGAPMTSQSLQANKSSSSTGTRSSQLGPAPSSPQLGFSGPQLQPNGSSTNFAPQPNLRDTLPNNQFQQQHHTNNNNNKAEKRFLPLELRSIEARNLQDGVKHKYILNFNCTKLSMVLVHQNSRVYVESMNLELRPASRQEATCELQLPPTGAFTVADSTSLAAAGPASQQQQPLQNSGLVTSAGSVNGTVTGSGTQFRDSSTSGRHAPSAHSNTKEYPHFAHYYCNKPLRYSCYHYNSKSGPSQTNGLLLAELHINGIEFETSTSWMGKHKKVKSEFKSKRSECNII